LLLLCHAVLCCAVLQTINNLGKKAREGTISIDEMAGGTFTISNGGVYGSMLSTPIINPPQVRAHSSCVDLSHTCRQAMSLFPLRTWCGQCC
jgi:hypothetical protein